MKLLQALTVEKRVGVVDVIKRLFVVCFVVFSTQLIAQEKDSLTLYQKKVLSNVEVDFLMSYYEQSGTHAAVTGGLGNEYLTNYAPTVVVRVPLNTDDVLTADVGISAYTSASSSNGNPFNQTGASAAYGNEVPRGRGNSGEPTGSPWVASTGASRKDILHSLNFSYAHASQDRNQVSTVNVGGSFEYDYESLGLGLGFAQLWNEKNTELSMGVQVYFDRWKPVIPTEMHEYELFGDGFLTADESYFSGVAVLNANGASVIGYNPNNFSSLNTEKRNSYSASIGFSQIVSSRLQFSVFADLVRQEGWLANPLQRVYFQDRPNFYVGNPNAIQDYQSKKNASVFHLADDIERLPAQRLKTPIGLRLNYYLSETMVLRSYYRYYQDDWGIRGNTFQLELPLRFGLRWKFTPIYRFYNQSAADYFAPYNQHLSSDNFYTSDYDLSKFDSHQFGMAASYTSIFSDWKLLNFGLKNIEFRFSNYNRSDGLNAFIVSSAFLFVLD